MGCALGKPSSAVEDNEDRLKQGELIKKASQLHLAREVSLKMEIPLHNGKLEEQSLMNGSQNGDFGKGMAEEVSLPPGIRSISGAFEAESVAAGWPSWLVKAAGEAVIGWIPRKAETFEKLDKIGEGTYSNVYKGRDLIHKKAVALKKVTFNRMDPESVKFMAREIVILRRLNHSNVINLEGVIVSKSSSSLYLVFEYMEHDLTGIATIPGFNFTEPQIKCYMQQLLSGLDHCHSHGVMHRDIKGSNLLIDNKGILKIADFGLAICFDNHQKNPLTSRVVTLWYRPPELLLGSKSYGAAIDLWSTGCLLGELYTGKPVVTGRNEVEQLHNIFKLCGSPQEEYWTKLKLSYFPGFNPYRRCIHEAFKHLPDAAVRLIDKLLSIDPSDRGTASSALDSEYFKTEPLACDPLSFPRFPPSKEMNAKLREAAAERRGVKGIKGGNFRGGLQAARKPAVISNLPKSTRIRHDPMNMRSQAESAILNVNEPPRSALGFEEMRKNHPKDIRDGISYSGFHAPSSGMMTSRTSSSLESRDSMVSSTVEVRKRIGVTQIFPNSHKPENREDDNGGTHKMYHFSGPLLATSNRLEEQVLRDHGRLIREST